MKKLFTFLTLALFAMVVNAQTAGDTYLDIAKYASIESAGYKTSAVNELISFDKAKRVLTISGFGAYQSVGTQKWITTDGSGSTDATWEAPEGSVFKGSAYYHTTTTAKASTVRSDRTTIMKVTGCSKIEALVVSNGTSDSKAVVVTILEEGVEEPVYTATDYTKANVILGKDGLDPTKVYTLKVSGTGSSNSRFFEAAFTLGQSSLMNAEVTNWNTLFGTNYNGSVSNVDALNGTIAGTTINVTYAKGSGSMYVKDDQIRIYAPTVITIACDPAKPMKKVVVTHSTSGDIFLKSTDGLYDKDTKTWTGSNNVVILQRGDEGTTGNVQLTKLEITYDNGEVAAVPLDPIFTFGTAGVKTSLDEDFIAPILKTNADNAPVYESNNTDVAEIDAASGVVNIKAAGTAVIKASVSASDNDNAAEASYKLSVAPAGTVFFAPMATGLDGFTPSDADIWSYNAQYSCAYGTAYQKEKTGTFDLVSPVIDLTEKQGAVLTFSHAGRYFAETVSDQAKLMVKEEADGAEWAEVAIPNHVTNENFNWVESGDIDLSAYDGKKIKIAFRYINDETKTGTWEIKNVIVNVPAAPVPVLEPYDYDTSCNLFKAATVTPKFYYAPGWSQIADPEVTVADGTYSYTLAEATFEPWQAQAFFVTDMEANAANQYDFSVTLTSSTDVSATLKLYTRKEEGGSNEVFFFSDALSLKANEPYVVKHEAMAGIDLNNLCLLLDVGGNPANTTIQMIQPVLKESTCVPVEPVVIDHLYLLGGKNEWGFANNEELPFDETVQAWIYEVNSPEAEHYFAFADKNDCASWDELNGEHRWALAAGNIVPEINAAYPLAKVNGTVKLPKGSYVVTVTKELVMTVTAATDGIKSVQGSGFTVNGEAYNLAGQRVGKDYKGIVIVNGKKVLVK